MEKKYSISFNEKLKMISTISDYENIFDLEFVIEHIFITDIPHILKGIKTQENFSYKNSVCSLYIENNLINCSVLFDEDMFNFKFEKDLFLMFGEDYYKICMQHKEILFPFVYMDIVDESKTL